MHQRKSTKMLTEPQEGEKKKIGKKTDKKKTPKAGQMAKYTHGYAPNKHIKTYIANISILRIM